jgi:hypothetical protein
MPTLSRVIGLAVVLAAAGAAAPVAAEGEPVAPLAAPAKPLVPMGKPGETYLAAFPKTIAIDGDLADWEGVPLVAVAKGPKPAPTPEDGSFLFGAVADAENLYVLVQVADRTIIAGQHGGDYWNEDSVEVYINATGHFDLKSYKPGVAQITFPAANLGKPVDEAEVSGSDYQRGIRVATIRTTAGYAIEAAIPLKAHDWTIKPAAGTTIGFQVQLNGAMTKDRDVKLSWSARDKTDLSYKDPSVFGRLVLTPVK